MDWSYLSPHLDDAVLSCGGVIAGQTEAGDRVTILNLCSGDPPNGPLSEFAQALHTQWGLGRDAVVRRREEDRLACKIVGAETVFFSVPDCIYRRSPRDGRALYDSEAAIFGYPDPEEAPLVQDLARAIAQVVPQGTQLVCPLAIGGHVDHRLARAAAESLGTPLRYYPDYPYVALHPRWLSGQPDEAEPGGWTSQLYPVAEDGLSKWQRAVAAYRSQIPVFWTDAESMAQAIADYHHRLGGILLWERQGPSGYPAG